MLPKMLEATPQWGRPYRLDVCNDRSGDRFGALLAEQDLLFEIVQAVERCVSSTNA
jgi:hypothetical protein